MLREALGLLLERRGCEIVGAAGNLVDGLAIVERTEPDVTLIDIGLGADSGLDLTRRLVADRPGRRIIIYTGSTDLGMLVEGLDSGARGYALKEGASEELLDAIRLVARGGTYIDPRLRQALLASHDSERSRMLSAREREIMELLAAGLTSDEVASSLVLSAETVKTHVRNAMNKLQARNRVHAIAIALRAGEISMRNAA
jgi:DNA-binding NarL/FixJ family response regulator